LAPEAAASVRSPTPGLDQATNTRALGQLIYTHYLFAFQAAGVILLISMIGAIVLTLRHKQGVKRQDVSVQVARNPATAMEVVKVKPGQGI
jgi:NADH-quinone oxidoreductase subunit J